MGLSYKDSVASLIDMHDIVPWEPRVLVKRRLEEQARLAAKSPIRYLDVEEGLGFFKHHTSILKGFSQGLAKEAFTEGCIQLLKLKQISYTADDEEDLDKIFDSMDFDGNGYLDTGEWAAALSVFFHGLTFEKAVNAVFRTLDTNENRTLSRWELTRYLSPLVKASTPREADCLRPLLLKKAVDIIYDEMSSGKKSEITSGEFFEWARNKRNNVVERVVKIIEIEVYESWVERRRQREIHQIAPWKAFGPEWRTDPYNKDRPVGPLSGWQSQPLPPGLMGYQAALAGNDGKTNLPSNSHAEGGFFGSLGASLQSYSPLSEKGTSFFGLGGGTQHVEEHNPHDPFHPHGGTEPPHPGPPPLASGRPYG
eukprot:TRINITY_DN16604_c0_g1_i2.p1 TRINITY_DN16604_c0_g1~~TRINITY_DN16604_c0_g1_i2.p1  ORF type:complete len:405 (-),score=67.97 TRINITY_DN16604_c0_g1_i2:211-1311(-)